MNARKIVPFAFALFALTAGCAAESSDGDSSSDQDIKAAPKAVTGANAETLMDALTKANAPSSVPAGQMGVGGRVGRIQLTTAQGGMAHFVSEGGEMSTVEGTDLGNVLSLGLDWSALEKALLASGMKWDVTEGAHGASSSKMLVKATCTQVVAPNAKPTCTLAPMSLTASDSATLMAALENTQAPSNTAPGLLGVSSRIARVTMTFAQGGIAHYVREGLTVDTLDGKNLGDLGSAGVDWAALKTALLNGGSTWATTPGANGASSSKTVAMVQCSRVVAPNAKPNCTVTPEFDTQN
jgi:hypothetical protein